MNKTDLREKRQHLSDDRPYQCYSFRIPEQFPDGPLHWHPLFEMHQILEGGSIFICGDDHITVRAGDMVLIPPNMLHAIQLPPGMYQHYDTLVFSGDMLGAGSCDRSSTNYVHPLAENHATVTAHLHPGLPFYEQLRHLVADIFLCAKMDTAETDLLMKSRLLELHYQLVLHGCIRKTGRHRSDAMRPVLEFIDRHYRDPISTRDLAAAGHMSPSHLMNSFQRLFGMSAMTYIIRLRIRYACEQLLDTDATVSSIAYDSGYRNLSNFNRQFHKSVGCSPLAYRRKFREGGKDK